MPLLPAPRSRSAPRHGQASLSPAGSYHDSALPEWLLVDGSSIIFRSFYGVPQTNRAPDGTLINALRGFLDTLARRIDERNPRHVAVTTAQDRPPDWRVERIPSYKAPRT